VPALYKYVAHHKAARLYFPACALLLWADSTRESHCRHLACGTRKGGQMEGHLTMSSRERERLKLFERVKRLSLREAAELYRFLMRLSKFASQLRHKIFLRLTLIEQFTRVFAPATVPLFLLKSAGGSFHHNLYHGGLHASVGIGYCDHIRSCL